MNPGTNNINRRSDQSSVTIPLERSLIGGGKQPSADQVAARGRFNFCGCGWPQHLLIPKGRPEGQQFDLFVMVSNIADDAVNQTLDATDGCSDAASFCGLRDRLYPDRRSMGYPFDRRSTVTTLANFIAKGSNMATAAIKITHSNTLVPRS